MPPLAVLSAPSVAGILPLVGDDRTEDEARVCGEVGGDLCVLVYGLTGNETVGRAADLLLARPLRIVFIVVLALVISHFVQRGIRRFLVGLESSAQRGITLRKGDGLAPLLTTGPLTARSKQRAETIGLVLRSLAKVLIWSTATLMVLGEIGINLGPLIAGAGIVGVAIGFGAQSLVRDFLSGIFMLIEDQFGVGDIIDAGEATGTVEGVSLRTTRLRDVEGTLWHIPNGEIRRIANFSQEWSRALLDIEVAYQTDLGRAEEVIKRVADEVWHDERYEGSIVAEPEVWGVQSLGASGIAIRLVIKTKPSDQWMVLRALRRAIKDAFDAEGIEIPFPQQTVWVRGDEDAAHHVFPAVGGPQGEDTDEPGA